MSFFKSFLDLFKKKEEQKETYVPKHYVLKAETGNFTALMGGQPVEQGQKNVQTLAQYAVTHGVSPANLAAFLSMASGIPGDNAEKVDRWLNPHKYMTDNEIAKEQSDVKSWDSNYIKYKDQKVTVLPSVPSFPVEESVGFSEMQAKLVDMLAVGYGQYKTKAQDELMKSVGGDMNAYNRVINAVEGMQAVKAHQERRAAVRASIPAKPKRF